MKAPHALEKGNNSPISSKLWVWVAQRVTKQHPVDKGLKASLQNPNVRHKISQKDMFPYSV
ncbi:putative HMP/thiamine import ATP-binding protein YkoD [Sesbania bispinosa]|nr:putative HMP/thiamine import ATP-binding protein YkoD [Sesbania bispinosa]